MPRYLYYYIIIIIISSAALTYVNQLYVLVVEELERHGHVFQLLRPERRPFVVLGQSLAAEHLDERDQPETVAQVRFQIADGLSGRLQVLIGPPGKRVLLDELPARVLGQVPFGGSHVVLLTAGFVSVRIVRRGRRRRHCHCRHSWHTGFALCACACASVGVRCAGVRERLCVCTIRLRDFDVDTQNNNV